ncbi:neurogenic locus notch homolog protein 2-like [Saccostrea echinata]|uniref:neurogenic locus notch homolog protein 2-like n=1 Tax=Saccostrea echinata TaxID=191078 RepID=UPI002A82BF16|nr:neurogenic locus notch homolog protein 2-like [Saccostrea echinata]
MYFLYCSLILGVFRSCVCVLDTKRYVYGPSKMYKSQSSFVRDSLHYTYPRGSLSNSISGDDIASPAIHVGNGAHGIPIGYNKTHTYVFVSSNGQILFGNNNSSPHPIKNYTGPDMLAPYWTDLNPRGGNNGYVFYKTYDASNQFDQSIISKADYDVLYNSGISHFSAKWVLVVTWWNTEVVDFPDDDRITIQCVLMTDFITTYAVFNYMNVDVDPTHTTHKVAIGYKTNVRTLSNSHSFKDDAFGMSNFRGNTGEHGVWFYVIADDNDCKWKPCQNGGSCVEKYGGYQCSCFTGFTGINCENDINECLDSPCSNGTCVNSPGSYICGCNLGFTGEHCDQDINECNSTIMSCKNNASCYNDIGSFKCTCTPGWNGTFCDQDINECEEKPCLYGTCVNTAGSYHCNCRAGIGGQLCDEDINECVDAYPCENNGTCVNTIGTFRCTCTLDYVGLTCSYENSKLLAPDEFPSS